jgi:hypothetical protein
VVTPIVVMAERVAGRHFDWDDPSWLVCACSCCWVIASLGKPGLLLAADRTDLDGEGPIGGRPVRDEPASQLRGESAEARWSGRAGSWLAPVVFGRLVSADG